MQTGSIRYRVADFLKSHPPFQSMEQEDLLMLAAQGRVKFHEADEFICWQGDTYGPFVFVIEQGTVSLWEASEAGERLRDILGAGDMVGLDRYLGHEKSIYSAKTTSDVVIYALRASDFAPLLEKYAEASRWVSSNASISPDYEMPEQRRAVHEMTSGDILRHGPQCSSTISLRDAVRQMRSAGASAIAVVDVGGQLDGVLNVSDVLGWIAEGGVDLDTPLNGVLGSPPVQVESETRLSDGALSMMTTDAVGVTRGGRFAGLLTAAELGMVFGDDPLSILRQISYAKDTNALLRLHRRGRALILEHLVSAAAVDWLTRFSHALNVAMLRRVIVICEVPVEGCCWCFIDSGGRRELLSPMLPQFTAIAGVGKDTEGHLKLVASMLLECGYLTNGDGLHCASSEEWHERYRGWIEDPIGNRVFEARPWLDLWPVAGNRALWEALEAALLQDLSAGPAFVPILANDCLSNLPPLTFFRDRVVEDSGNRSDVFYLERSALRPLVDVGRVLGLVSGQILGASTLERFELAGKRFPQHESLLREAVETLRVVLFHQGRAGIRRQNDGSELPPALLSRYDRQVLKNGFRSILRLLEFTAGNGWLEKA